MPRNTVMSPLIPRELVLSDGPPRQRPRWAVPWRQRERTARETMAWKGLCCFDCVLFVSQTQGHIFISIKLKLTSIPPHQDPEWKCGWVQKAAASSLTLDGGRCLQAALLHAPELPLENLLTHSREAPWGWPLAPSPPGPETGPHCAASAQDHTDQISGSALWVHICKPAVPLQESAQGSTKQRKANTEVSCEAQHSLNTRCCC